MKKFILGICIGATIVGSMASFATSNYVSLVERQNADIVALENEIAHLEFTNKQLMNENSYLSEQVKWTSLGQFKITFYWPGEDEYGSMTATGVTAKEGRTIAVDPNIIPYGSEIRIGNDPTVYIAQDTGSALIGNKTIDVYVEEPHQEMFYQEVFIKEWWNGYSFFKTINRIPLKTRWIYRTKFYR